jgi:Icc-related predicted phosphoesterase
MARERLIFFATDVHGSERCFRKFLAAASAYGADTLVMGGDITGKVIVPIHPEGSGHVSRWRDVDYRLDGADELSAFMRELADAGAYGWVAERDEAAEVFADELATEALFVRLTAERVREWVELADERLGDGVQAFAIAGNDDAAEIDLALGGGTRMKLAEGRVTWIDDWLPMISYGDSTPTPWNSPREVSEEAYGVRLDALIDQLAEPQRAIFNLHVPPHDTQLDMAPALDDQLRVRYSKAGDMMLAPVGSHAVRERIEREQPMFTLHGHVHESKGRAKLGKTVCFNPGSDYQKGVLCGVLIRASARKGVCDYAFTTG